MVKGGHPMIGASKILTVSYGTFSCTLEGFDDPFNTMRAIAEYFRDLAAEDRYFGAEPPTPDAAMLLKIAEREVQRRVEAKINENGVVLRTGEAMQSPAYVAASQPPSPMPAPARAAQTAPEFVPEPAPMPDGVAAKLLRIRAAVANAELAETHSGAQAETQAEAAPTPIASAPTAPILTDYSEDQHADEIGTTSTLTATFAPEAFETEGGDAYTWDEPIFSSPVASYDEDLGTDEPLVVVADIPAQQLSVIDETAFEDEELTPVIAEPNFVPAHNDLPDDASLSTVPEADLAPVSEFDDSLLAASITTFAQDITITEPATTEVEAEDYTISEDEMADLRALDGDAAETPTALATDAAADFAIIDEADDAFDDSEAIEASTEQVTEAFADFAAIDETVDAFDDDEADLAEIGEKDAAVIDHVADVEDEPAAMDATATVDPMIEDAAVDPMIEEIDNVYDAPDEGPNLAATSGPSAKALRARARVIKVRRDDVEVPPALTPDTTSSDVAAMLAADAEADLRRELRALQQQSFDSTAAKTDESDDQSGLEDEAGTEDDARQRLDTAGEAAVSRLIEQTNEAMAVPENRRRLSAIAHLKAAVAATVADRFAKGGAAPKEVEAKRLDPYREDLARVVRPQPPAGSDDVPPTPRPAPLVLVSAQRIDRPRTTPTEGAPILSAVPSGKVSPRRVTSAALAVDPIPETEDDDENDAANVFSDARGFAEFSERLGANSLAEILEAAAAYSVCVEGRPYFSRPQLMSQIGALSADSEFSREDGLRTFGAMLREGRIQKIKRGQFVLTESSRYLAEARALAG